MLEEGDNVLVEYKLGREKTWHEAILKQKLDGGWTVIWLTRDHWYGTTTTDVPEAKIRLKSNWHEKMEKLLEYVAIKRSQKLHEKVEKLTERFSTLVKPLVPRIVEMEARQTRIEHMLDELLQNQCKILEKHRQLTEFDSASWEAICED